MTDIDVGTWRIFVYMLVTADIRDASERVDRLKMIKGITLYAQAERNYRKGIESNAKQLEFAQRYVYKRCLSDGNLG